MYTTILLPQDANKKFVHERKRQLKLEILRFLYKNGSQSIPDLSGNLEHSTPTITRAVESLIDEDNLVINLGEGVSKGGRRPNYYGLNPEAKYILALDISRYYTKICLYDFVCNPKIEVKTINEGFETTNDILSFIKVEVNKYLSDSKIDTDKIVGAGIAIPGLINIKTGMSYTYLKEDEPAHVIFKDLLNIPAFVINDTKAMTLSELYFGKANGKKNVLYLTVGSGVGLGIIVNGKLYHGTSGYTGEFGHIQVQPDGKLCSCGKIGCLETVASGRVLIENIINDLSKGSDSIIRNMVNDDFSSIDANTVTKAAQKGDFFSIQKLAEIGERLGQGITTLIHLFNPEMIIIGGDLAVAGNFITDPIQHSINKYALQKIKRDANIVASEIGENTTLMGAYANTMNAIFNVS
ncbi:MAG: ROK family transcriptional regulator [Lentimicrobiaceae bacterium]|nr:ROK family transcriptional regulator [Lentimicrobiaceae bacterium]